MTLEEVEELFRRSPYQRLLGLVMTRVSDGEAVVRMPFREDLLAGDDDAGRYIHGGAIASLIDAAGDFAIIAAVRRDVPTIDLRIDYLRPAAPGALTATGRAVRVGRSLAVADIEVVNEAGTPIAVGRGLFKA
jgi:uncharacterized protein (TIGR00369 family)